METLKEIKTKLSNIWGEIQQDRYMCYPIKELAYEIAFKIGMEIEDNFETTIMYRSYDDKNKIIFPLTKINGKTIFFGFDIIVCTGMFGDVVQLIRNGRILGKMDEMPKGYKDIEEVFEDEEEEVI